MTKEEIISELDIRLKQRRQIQSEIEELQRKYDELNSSGTVDGRNKSDS